MCASVQSIVDVSGIVPSGVTCGLGSAGSDFILQRNKLGFVYSCWMSITNIDVVHQDRH